MQFFLVFTALFILEIIYFKIADKYSIIDKPNERSSHTQITLRGGGIIFYFAALAYFLTSSFEYPYFILGLTLITLVSFLDDVLTLSNKIRLSVHLISVGLLCYQVGLFNYNLLWIPVVLVLIIGTINAYNFMDGINGITVSYSTSVLLLLALTNHFIPFIDSNFIYYILIANVVFGYFNFRQKAKCFAGDVGSVAMAFIIVFLITKLVITTSNPLFILFLLVYGLDTVWTILRRLSKKENIFKAHRSHLYQYLANENNTNKLVVASMYGIIQLITGLVILYAALNASNTQQIFVAAILLLLGSGTYLVVKKKLINKFNL